MYERSACFATVGLNSVVVKLNCFRLVLRISKELYFHTECWMSDAISHGKTSHLHSHTFLDFSTYFSFSSSSLSPTSSPSLSGVGGQRKPSRGMARRQETSGILLLSQVSMLWLAAADREEQGADLGGRDPPLRRRDGGGKEGGRDPPVKRGDGGREGGRKRPLSLLDGGEWPA